MQIEAISIERPHGANPCGTLHYQLNGRRAAVLWLAEWRRAQKISVELVPAEGAAREDLRVFQNRIVDAVLEAVYEQRSRKTLFTEGR